VKGVLLWIVKSLGLYGSCLKLFIIIFSCMSYNKDAHVSHSSVIIFNFVL